MLGSQSCGCKPSEGEDWPYHVGDVEQDVEYVSRYFPLLMSVSQRYGTLILTLLGPECRR